MDRTGARGYHQVRFFLPTTDPVVFDIILSQNGNGGRRFEASGSLGFHRTCPKNGGFKLHIEIFASQNTVFLISARFLPHSTIH